MASVEEFETAEKIVDPDAFGRLHAPGFRRLVTAQGSR
jgi:hypothetical protein